MSQPSSKDTFKRPDCRMPTPAQRILAGVMNDVPISMGLYLTSPAEWAVFSQAFLAMARDLQIQAYLFHGQEIPAEPVGPTIPSSVVEEGPPLLVNLSIQDTDDYDEKIRLARGRSAEELEEFNAKLGSHNDSFRGFMAVRKNLEQMRSWIILHVSTAIQGECLPGIQKGLRGSQSGGLHPREWYANLAGYMDAWVRYNAAKRRYLAQWCCFFETVEKKAEPGLGRARVEKTWFLDWIQDLIEIARDERQSEVREVMDEKQWFRGHLIGFGVIDSVFEHEKEAVGWFVEEIEEKMGEDGNGVNPEDILWRLYQMVEVSFTEEDMDEFLTITVIGGGEGAADSSRHGAAREEYERVKAELSRLQEAVARAEGEAGAQVAVRPHVPKVAVQGSSPQPPEEKPDTDSLQEKPEAEETLLKCGEKMPEPECEVRDVAAGSPQEGVFTPQENTENPTTEPAQQPEAESKAEDAPPKTPEKRRKRDAFQRLARRASLRAKSLFSKDR